MIKIDLDKQYDIMTGEYVKRLRIQHNGKVVFIGLNEKNLDIDILRTIFSNEIIERLT